MKNDKTPMRIDIDEVLRQRMSGYYKFIPKFAVKFLERVICQDGLNRLLLHNVDKSGVDFCRVVIDDLGVSYRVNGLLPKNNSR
ncbi:MAG: hypothetical protein K2G17_06405, partial [Duncaniella sp.]|nr:hypothetical protein [Duncaniella sp.]